MTPRVLLKRGFDLVPSDEGTVSNLQVCEGEFRNLFRQLFTVSDIAYIDLFADVLKISKPSAYRLKVMNLVTAFVWLGGHFLE